MFTKPIHGWTTLQIEGYKFSASYLTDVPNDCIDAFYGLKNNRPTTIFFDDEGKECYLICDTYTSYVIYIDDYNKTKVIEFNKGIKELAQEFINNIEENFEDWQLWECYHNELLEIDLTELKELLKV